MYLHQAVPVILGLGSVAVWAHLVGHRVLHHEGLLQDGAAHHLGLHLQLHLEPLAVRLRPQEARVYQLHLLQPLEPLEAERHQLPALQRRLHPLPGRLEVTLAESAELDGHLNTAVFCRDGDDSVTIRIKLSAYVSYASNLFKFFGFYLHLH